MFIIYYTVAGVIALQYNKRFINTHILNLVHNYFITIKITLNEYKKKIKIKTISKNIMYACDVTYNRHTTICVII